MKSLCRWEIELKLLAALAIIGVLLGTCCNAHGQYIYDELRYPAHKLPPGGFNAPVRPQPVQPPALHPTFRAMIDATNAERRARGHAPLVADPQLQAMAETWGKHMANVGRMYHSSYGVGENVAWNQSSPAEVTNDWMNSRGHRANILGPYTRIGCAAYRGKNGNYWVQCFR